MVAAHQQTSLSMIEEQVSMFQRRFEEEVHLRTNFTRLLLDQVDTFKQDTLDAITRERTERESEDHNLQISLYELTGVDDV